MSLTGPDPDEPTARRRADRRPARRHVRRLRRGRRPARAQRAPAAAGSCAPRCSPPSSACTPSRAPATPWPARCPTRQGNHHPSITPYGLFSCQDGMLQIAVRQRGPVAASSRPRSASTPPRPGMATNRERVGNRDARHRRRQRRVRRPHARRAAARAGRDRRPRRRGAHPRPGLRLGPDPLAGPGDRRRPPGARPHRAPRAADALRRQRVCRRPQRAPRPRRCSASTTTSVRAWLDEQDAGRRADRARSPGAGSAPASCSTSSSTRAAGESWDRPRCSPPPRTAPYAAELAAAAGRPGPTSRSSPARAPSAGAGSPWWSASSASSPARSAASPAERLVLAVRAGHARGAAAVRGPVLRRHPDAGGHPGLRRHGQDLAPPCAAHKAAGLPYLVYLRHPTTGGVFASWGSLGHVTVAEPGALVGFLGPRVYEALYGAALPRGRADRREPLRARAASTPCCPSRRWPRSPTGR